jgi:2-succinyl-5-enolpyruvyl-6-hydroxy-3-cyclohexene-1-carboxylate synthase
MTKETGQLNEEWGRLIIKELVHHGVTTFCMAPGARSTPLVIAAASHPLAETIVHYDERGLAFHALGIAKGKRKPVALIITSGSALGNIFPAVMEAHHDQVPLILLTADRPPEVRDTGGNQTTDQVGLFAKFVRYSSDLPCPDPKIPQGVVERVVAQGISRALSQPKGPIQLNCMYRTPLAQKGEGGISHQISHAETALNIGKLTLSPQDYKQIARELTSYEKGIIVVSGTHPIDDPENLYKVAQILHWPIFPDILSNVRGDGEKETIIPYHNFILNIIGANATYAPDAILQIGDRFVSQELMDWIASKKPKLHCHLSSHSLSRDETHTVTRKVNADPSIFLENFPAYLSARMPSNWLKEWKTLSKEVTKRISSYFKKHEDLSEPHIFHRLKDYENTAFFFSNSMPIRNGNTLFFPKGKGIQLYGNRGLSGIDGNIATAAGIAKGLGRPLIACLGDLSFLHDLNSLPLLKGAALKLIVINNDGGDIFTFLPIHERKEVFKTYFRTPHHILSFKEAAKLFNLKYESPMTMVDLEKALKISENVIIEIKTKGGENKKIQQELLTVLKEL